MAHIGIVSAAFYGDVMPYVPIADELSRRGHRVTMAVPEGFHEILDGSRFDLVHLGTDFSPRELAQFGHVMERANSIRGMRAATDLWVRQLTIEPARQILPVLDDLAPDLWLVHPSLTWLVQLQATPTNTPVAVGHLFPMLIPSAEQPPPMLPGGGPRALAPLAWRLMRTMSSRMMFDREINELRASRGLQPVVGNVTFAWERADRTLVLTSPVYWPRPADWDDRVTMTGFTVWGSDHTDLPPDLEGYLAEGPAPVLATLGTSAASNAQDAFTLIANAVEAAGHRALLLAGPARTQPALADRDDVWTFAPLPAVLPRCRAIVHAGGHGTVAAALHAGVPQVTLPQGFDQAIHAQRLTELGVGTTVAWKRRDVDRLAASLTEADRPSVRDKASDLASRLAGEDGAAVASDAIEALLAG